MQLKARADHGLSPAGGREVHHVSVSFTAPDIESGRQRQAVNIALVLDRSGSMAGAKLRTAHAAVEQSLALLRETDRFALVVFDDAIDVLARSRPADDAARRDALRALAGVEARGMTNLAGGWVQGAGELEPHRDPARLSRVILATDGMANRGEARPEALIETARKLRAQGISTTTIGIGADFREDLLRGMADAGGGHAYYAEKPGQLVDILAGELGEALEVTLRDAVLDVAIPRGVTVELLDAFPVTRRADGMRVAPGDLTARQLVELVFEVALPPGAVGDAIVLDFTLRAGGEERVLAHTEQRWTFATPEAAAAAPRAPEVQARAARLIGARAEEEALNLNREGRYAEAEARLEAAIERISRLGPGNEQVERVARGIRRSSPLYREAMPSMSRKAMYEGATLSQRGRIPGGAARKG
jgi:Ca-activated chloride channel family protein